MRAIAGLYSRRLGRKQGKKSTLRLVVNVGVLIFASMQNFTRSALVGDVVADIPRLEKMRPVGQSGPRFGEHLTRKRSQGAPLAQ